MAKNNRNRSSKVKSTKVDVTKGVAPETEVNDTKVEAVPATRIERRRKEKSDLLKWLISLAVITGLIIVGLLTFLIIHNNNNDSKPTTTKTTEVKVEVGKTGKSLEQDQKDAVAAAAKILNDSGKNPKKLSEDEILKKLDGNDLTVIDKSVTEGVRFTDVTPDVMKVATYESLVTLYNIFHNGKTGALTPSADGYKSVYVDQSVGSAFVPLGVFAKGGSAFSMEFVNINGQWKLSPYSLIDAIKLSSTLSSVSGATSGSTSSVAPSSTATTK